MRFGRVRCWVIALLLSSVVAGCQAADESPASPALKDAAQKRSTNDAAKNVGSPGSAELLADRPQPAAGSEFMPPFPDRLELFEPPKRAQGMVRQGEQSGESVELKGFVNVDEPRVVLSIDGVIAPIPEGGEKFGVQVISIQPPSVVLQRGRSRWTATLE